ncbi:MAG TPA: TetR/AcrR family transcriptional regulator [Puia sp.]|nr:TetR/AcrR family transcriptional regulator [Puia sp.]
MRTRDPLKEKAIRHQAMEMIVKDGFDGLSMQKLAKAAEVSPATIYIYFKDREDLILRVFSEVNDQMMTITFNGFDPEMDFEAGMRVQWRNRAKYFMKHPLEIQFMEQLRYSPLYDKTVSISTKAFAEVMGKFFKNAIERKELMPLPFEVFWSTAFAPLYQLVKFHSQGRSYVNKKFRLTDEMMDQTLKLVLKALKP